MQYRRALLLQNEFPLLVQDELVRFVWPTVPTSGSTMLVQLLQLNPVPEPLAFDPVQAKFAATAAPDSVLVMANAMVPSVRSAQLFATISPPPAPSTGS